MYGKQLVEMTMHTPSKETLYHIFSGNL